MRRAVRTAEYLYRDLGAGWRRHVRMSEEGLAGERLDHMQAIGERAEIKWLRVGQAEGGTADCLPWRDKAVRQTVSVVIGAAICVPPAISVRPLIERSLGAGWVAVLGRLWVVVVLVFVVVVAV